MLVRLAVGDSRYRMGLPDLSLSSKSSIWGGVLRSNEFALHLLDLSAETVSGTSHISRQIININLSCRLVSDVPYPRYGRAEERRTTRRLR